MQDATRIGDGAGDFPLSGAPFPDWNPCGSWRDDAECLGLAAQELHVTSLQHWLDLSA